MKTIRNSLSHLAAFLCVAFALPLASSHAQEEPAATEKPAPPIINELIVNFTGLSNVNEEVARSHMSLRPGEPYDAVVVDRDIRSLYRSGLFEYIEARLAVVGDNLVDVIFDIRPKFRLSAIIFEGNEAVKDFRLENEIDIVVNQTLSEPLAKAAAEKIQEFYVKRGYSQARVDYKVDRSPVTGFATLTFQVKEGRKFKIKAIEFSGVEELPKRKLKKAMQTKKWGIFSFLTGGGTYDEDKFQEDLEALKDLYRKEGYLDIEIEPQDVKFTYPSNRRMKVEVEIDEGRQYRIGKIEFRGNKIYDDDTLRLMLRVAPGSVYRPEKLDEDVSRLEDFYGRFGYMETRIRMNRIPNVDTGDIDIQYSVNESEVFKVESIDIEGNTKTKSVVVLRELALSPGSTFDSVRMESSRMRLDNTRYFEDTNVTPQSTNVEGRKDVRITFREGRTGNFSFGAGFSSLERGVFFIELTQSNFDIMNWRGAFQGDGQKFRLKAQLGGLSSSILLAFEEPWLFERRLAFGFSIFDSSQSFTGDPFEQEQRGFEVSLRKRLIELIEGRLTYSQTKTGFDFTGSVSDLDDAERAQLRDQLRDSSGGTASLNLLLIRDTRDRLINPLRGMRLELDLTYAGDFLGGNFDYYKVETRNAFYVPLFEKHQQTIEFLFRAGITNGLDSDNKFVPRNELFFLGGPNTLRGFEFRDVSPKTGGFAPGGKTYGMFGAEYSIGITNDFRFAVFYDGGFVNKATSDFSLDRSQIFRVSNFDGSVRLDTQSRSGWQDNYGFGIRMSMAGTPLRLDYAIPIDTDGDSSIGGSDNGAQFNFSFGGRF